MSRRRLWAMSLAAATAACGAESAEPAEAGGTSAGFEITATIEEVMRYIVDPAADAVWDAVVTEVTAEGVASKAPATTEEWEALRRHAMTLVEAPNLLLMEGRPVAAPGSRSELPGVDLEPEEIEALLADDRAGWAQFVGGLRQSGLAVLAAIDEQDVDSLLVAGDGLDLACENCHLRFWYPTLPAKDEAR